MNSKLRVTIVCVCLALTGTLALAAVPVTVFPNPGQFGTVSLGSTASPLPVFLSNSSASAVTITGITISGTSSANFSVYGFACVGIISSGQVCQMYLTFTPSTMTNLTASLVIVESGVTSAITIPLQGTGGNPIPNITSLSPPTVYVSSATTTITINGSGFLPSSLPSLSSFSTSNTSLPTTFVSATQIKTQIPDTVLANTGGVSIAVTNPQPGGGSTSASLSVISAEPSIGNVSPTSIAAGTASEPILFNGANFMTGAKVQWNGTSIPTTYLNSGQLQAQPINPSPGTISPPISFNLTYPVNVTVLDLPANDLVWDPFAQLIYASLPSSYGPNGNSIAVINPSTGAVTGFFFAGSEPTKLALDSTAKFLYVGLNGTNSIQRLVVPGFTKDIAINLGSVQNGGPNLAQAIAVSPTNSHTIAVAVTESGCCSGSGVEFFTDSTKLASSVSSPQVNQLAFASGTTLYGYIPNTLSQISVSSTGGTLVQQWAGLVDGNTFQYSGGLLFGSAGEEFNPATGMLQGTFDVGSTCCNNSSIEVLPDPAINRAFALGQTPFFGSFGITSYNLSQFTPLAVASLAEFTPSFSSLSTSKFIQWGPNGLAFIMSNGCCGNATSQIVLVQSPTLLLTASKIVSPTPLTHSSSPAAVYHGSGNTLMNVVGSGFVPGSVVHWNNKVFSAKYVSKTQMTVYVPKAAMAAPGTAAVVVKNPTPGGGTSNALTVTIK